MKPHFRLDNNAITDYMSCPRRACFYALSPRQTALTRGLSGISRIQILHNQKVVGLVRNEFPDGLAIDCDLPDALHRTRTAIKTGTRTLFNAAFSHNRVAVRADILTRKKSGQWWLWEIKPSAEMKKSYLQEMAVQIHVIESHGITVQPTVVLLDRGRATGDTTYVKHIGCNKRARAYIPAVKKAIHDFKANLRLETIPEVPLERRCRDCSLREECWPDLPADNVFQLYQGHGGWRNIEALLGSGCFDLGDVPDETTLTTIQKRQMRANLSRKPVVEPRLREKLEDSLRYPLHFLDFEAVRPPIPEYANQHPFDLIPFQWSCHVQERPETSLDHCEFLANGRGDPRRALTESLLECLRPEGSIVVYSSFELEVIRSMAGIFPDLSARLLALESRLLDILPILRDYYYDPGFGGSFSIKKVLPVLVPGKGYERLAIHDGMEAVLSYYNLLSDKITEGERKKIQRDLLEYCKLDSIAMYGIVHALLGA